MSGQTIDIEIKKIVPRGLGIAFTKDLTVFVPLSAAGDLLRVRLMQVKGGTAFAEIVEILEPSSGRTDPPCRYFGECGGCDFQHLKYSEQLAAKAAMLIDSLQRIGKIDYQKEIEIFPSPEQFEYRSRAVWHADPCEKTLGYFKRGSHDVVDIENCPIITPELNNVLHDLRQNIDWASFSHPRVAIEAASAGGEVSVYSNELIEPTTEIRFTSGGESYKYNARSFFQANQYLVGELVNAVIGGIEGRCAFDLYCGVGLFTIPLARKFERVYGVEGNLDAVEFAKANASDAAVENINFIAESVDGFLESTTGDELDLIVLDPPRSGTEKGTIERIIQLSPAAISFVACDPSVLARDLNILLTGGYEIDFIKLFDLFPQTHHIETIVRLSRNA